MAIYLRYLLWLLLVGCSAVPVVVVFLFEESSGVPESLVMPLCCAALIFVSVAVWGSAEFLSSRRASSKGSPIGAASSDSSWSTAWFLRAFGLFVLGGVSLYAISYLGFFLATLVLFIGGAALLLEKRVSRYILGVLLWAGIVYLLFSWILMVPLPEGSFFS